MRAIFYDTWAFLALANRRDPAHRLAVVADEWRETHGYHPVTSDYVLDETLTGLHAEAGARVAIDFADGFAARVQAETLGFVEVITPRREAGVELFQRLAPETPRLSFTDCTSIALMHELGLELVFTADRHFHRGGKGVRPLFDSRGTRLTFRPPHE